MTEKVRNSPLDTLARTPPQNECVHSGGFALNRSMRNELSHLDGNLQDSGTGGESIKLSRRKGRRYRREALRLKIRQDRSEALGGVDEVFNYHDLYKAGKKCCNGVRWKQSVQQFELRLFSGTAVRRRAILSGNYKFSPYVHFILSERGKTRPIDAPRIQDRQVQKVYTQKVLLPLYLPSMIYNNGASLPKKGFHFSQRMLTRDLIKHFRKYGREGGIILADGKKFFPSANHDHIYERHNRLILDEGLRAFGNAILKTVKGGVGMPLGVEPSQAEMIAYTSELDNCLSAQFGLTVGHYMDDYYILVPPNRDYRKIIEILNQQVALCCIRLNASKTRFLPLCKPFRYCKTKYTLTTNGGVLRRCNRGAMPRDRRKVKTLYKKVNANKMSYEDVWTSLNGMLAYLQCYNEHNSVLTLRRLFYSIFGFSCELIENFRKRDKIGIRNNQAIQRQGNRWGV